MRHLIATALLLTLATPALAGRIHARIEGPGPDGVTYTARTVGCGENDTLEPWAYAEGIVEGKRQSVLIRLTPTREHGTYQFTRTWPNDGLWMIRYSLGHPPAPATVATLRADGSVRKNALHSNSDGSQECHKALRRAMKLNPDDENC